MRTNEPCWQAWPITRQGGQLGSDTGDDQPGEDVLSDVLFTGLLIIKGRGQQVAFLPDRGPSTPASLRKQEGALTCVGSTAKQGGGTEETGQGAQCLPQPMPMCL